MRSILVFKMNDVRRREVYFATTTCRLLDYMRRTAVNAILRPFDANIVQAHCESSNVALAM